MSNVKAFVDQRIQGKKVMVFSKSYCPYCTKAKEVFAALLKDGTLSQDDYELLEIDGNPDCDAIQDYLLKLTGGRSVPRVFVNQKFIGGGDDVKRMQGAGQLAALLK